MGLGKVTCTMEIPQILFLEVVLQGGKQQSKTNPDNPKTCPLDTIKKEESEYPKEGHAVMNNS